MEEIATKELIDRTLRATDEDDKWNYIMAPHQRGTRDVFEAALFPVRF